MKKLNILIFALCSAAPSLAFAQREGGDRVRQERRVYAPPRGPEPYRVRNAIPEARRGVVEAPPAGRPYYVTDDHRWVGHESGPHDPRYRVAQPWIRGRFNGGIGREHVYVLNGYEGRRFWFGNSWFEVAAPDWDYSRDWYWDRDRIVVYDDPDHEGWYLAYNLRTGSYVHVQYIGSRE